MSKTMKKTPLLMMCAILSAATVACQDSPAEVLAAIEEAARKGDAVAFAAHFTPESRPFAETLVKVQKAARPDEPAPVEKFSKSTATSTGFFDDFAVVTASYPDGSQSKIVFKNMNGKWLLDPAATESGSVPDGSAVR